ncbi:MAG: hypothetical protein ACYCY2_02295 [Acidithiobacillus ferriphilus]
MSETTAGYYTDAIRAVLSKHGIDLVLLKADKATNPPQGERKEPGVSIHTTTEKECDTWQARPSSDDLTEFPPTGCRGDPISAVAAIQGVADLADLCQEITAENRRLRKELLLLQDAVGNFVAEALGTRAKHQPIKTKLGDEMP